VIRIQPILASRSKGLDDRANPNRWWNTTGTGKRLRRRRQKPHDLRPWGGSGGAEKLRRA